MPALSGPLADSAGRYAEPASRLLDSFDEVMSGGHDAQGNVIFHTEQRESSHSPDQFREAITPVMNESEIFRVNLLAAMRDAGMSAAELSRKAKLNARAVKDIEERRTVSPKLSTVFSLARALNKDPCEMMGLGPRLQLNARLAAFLVQYAEADQVRFLSALELLSQPR